MPIIRWYNLLWCRWFCWTVRYRCYKCSAVGAPASIVNLVAVNLCLVCFMTSIRRISDSVPWYFYVSCDTLPHLLLNWYRTILNYRYFLTWCNLSDCYLPCSAVYLRYLLVYCYCIVDFDISFLWYSCRLLMADCDYSSSADDRWWYWYMMMTIPTILCIIFCKLFCCPWLFVSPLFDDFCCVYISGRTTLLPLPTMIQAICSFLYSDVYDSALPAATWPAYSDLFYYLVDTYFC